MQGGKGKLRQASPSNSVSSSEPYCQPFAANVALIVVLPEPDGAVSNIDERPSDDDPA